MAPSGSSPKAEAPPQPRARPEASSSASQRSSPSFGPVAGIAVGVMGSAWSCAARRAAGPRLGSHVAVAAPLRKLGARRRSHIVVVVVVVIVVVDVVVVVIVDVDVVVVAVVIAAHNQRPACILTYHLICLYI